LRVLYRFVKNIKAPIAAYQVCIKQTKLDQSEDKPC